MKVEQHMQRDPITVLAETPLHKVKKVMEENGFGILLVADEDATLRGFVTRGSLKNVSDEEQPVVDVCIDAEFAVSPDDTLEKAALVLLKNRLVLLPVVKEEQLVGIVTQADVLLALSRGLGIGLEATRLTAKIRKDPNDLYAIIDVLNGNDVHLISLVRGGEDNGYQDIILRVQGITNREELTKELEESLRSDSDA